MFKIVCCSAGDDANCQTLRPKITCVRPGLTSIACMICATSAVESLGIPPRGGSAVPGSKNQERASSVTLKALILPFRTYLPCTPSTIQEVTWKLLYGSDLCRFRRNVRVPYRHELEAFHEKRQIWEFGSKDGGKFGITGNPFPPQIL